MPVKENEVDPPQEGGADAAPRVVASQPSGGDPAPAAAPRLARAAGSAGQRRPRLAVEEREAWPCEEDECSVSNDQWHCERRAIVHLVALTSRLARVAERLEQRVVEQERIAARVRSSVVHLQRSFEQQIEQLRAEHREAAGYAFAGMQHALATLARLSANEH